MALPSASRLFHPMLLMAAAALASLLLVASVRWGGAAAPPAWTSPVIHSRALRFEDTDQGAVLVRDGQAGTEVARFEGEQGFLRGVLRAMARERRLQGAPSDAALLLQNHADGSLSLLDPSTGERINLESFGPTQRATFAPLQDAGTPGVLSHSRSP